jgi:hypothetical protein
MNRFGRICTLHYGVMKQTKKFFMNVTIMVICVGLPKIQFPGIFWKSKFIQSRKCLLNSSWSPERQLNTLEITPNTEFKLVKRVTNK